MKFCLIVLTIIAASSNLLAEEIIVKFDKNNTNLASLNWANLEYKEVLSKSLNIHLYKKNSQSVLTTLEILKQLNKSDAVEYAQENHALSLRSSPNDTKFSSQWSLNDNSSGVKAKEAWAISTGGIDKKGNDIVVAMIDDGMDWHKDLADNIWLNKEEIPNNLIDDDNNGYVDDVNGWNAFSNNGQIPLGSGHGTHVAGIIGAKGDNGQDISGLNWNVKIMPIAGSSGDTATVIKAYDYVLNQKKLWLDSKATKGANIVATNSSFGVDFADCKSGSYPAWNDIYNAMGEVGILSAAATANIAIDIDQRGDVPTGCSSPYIVSVTNTNDQAEKNSGAAWGRNSIDLGAPGTAILSTFKNNGLSTLTGTSMATPHIAGAIALIHSAASSDLNQSYLDAPAKTALAIKKILLDTVSPQTDLKDKSQSGGRLNLEAAIKAADSFINQ